MGSFFDEPEFKCAAGIGLTGFGIGALGVPLAVDSCQDVVEKVKETVKATVSQAPSDLREGLCLATDTAALLSGSLLPFGPITTLTMKYLPSTCQKEDEDNLEALKDRMLKALPYALAGVLGGGLAEYLFSEEISKQQAMEDLGRNLANALITGAMFHLLRPVRVPMRLQQVHKLPLRAAEMLGSYKQRLESVETLHLRRFFSPEKIERLYQELLHEVKAELKQLTDAVP